MNTPAHPTTLRVGVAVAIAAAASIALAGCSGPAHAPTGTHTSASRPSASQSASPLPTVSGPGVTAPTAEPSDSAEVAAAAVEAFCQPTRPKAAWFAALSPYLGDQAIAAYSTTVPGNVPCTDPDSGSGTPVGDAQTDVNRAYSFTAATGGPVIVTLNRVGTAFPWKVIAITPTENTQ